jgi:hypothetical protein
MKRSEIPRDSGAVAGCYKCRGSEEVTVMMRGADGWPYPYVFTCECVQRRADAACAALFAREVQR